MDRFAFPSTGALALVAVLFAASAGAPAWAARAQYDFNPAGS